MQSGDGSYIRNRRELGDVSWLPTFKQPAWQEEISRDFANTRQLRIFRKSLVNQYSVRWEASSRGLPIEGLLEPWRLHRCLALAFLPARLAVLMHYWYVSTTQKPLLTTQCWSTEQQIDLENSTSRKTWRTTSLLNLTHCKQNLAPSQLLGEKIHPLMDIRQGQQNTSQQYKSWWRCPQREHELSEINDCSNSRKWRPEYSNPQSERSVERLTRPAWQTWYSEVQGWPSVAHEASKHPRARCQFTPVAHQLHEDA